MTARRMDNTTTIALGVIFLFVCDRILKYWALYGLYHTKIDIIAGWATFELFKNPAIALSIPVPRLLIIPLAGV